MSVLSYASGDKFIFRVFKSLYGDLERRWSNAYEVVATASGTDATLNDLGTKLVACEKAMHGDFVFFDSYSVSTWTAEEHPYNPEDFLVVPLQDTVGSIALTNPLALEVCLMMKRRAASGRNGKIYYRGCLGEGDVQMANERFGLSDPTVQSARWDAIVGSTHLDWHYAGGALTLKLAMIALPVNVPTVQTRQLSDIVVSGVATVDMTHRWYNRAAAGA